MRKSAGTQIKVRTGQIWEPSPGYARRVESVDDIDVYWVGNSYTPLSELNENFTFVPQSDLEEIAIKLDKWYCASRFLRIKEGVPFTCDEHDDGAIHIFAWRDMRYYLGLDEKPHYKLIDGGVG